MALIVTLKIKLHIKKNLQTGLKINEKTGLTEIESSTALKELCSHNRISFEVKTNLNSKFFQITIWYDMKKMIKTDKLS